MNEETILRASHNMESAAESMRQTFDWWCQRMDQQKIEMNDWLDRLETVLKEHNATSTRK